MEAEIFNFECIVIKRPEIAIHSRLSNFSENFRNTQQKSATKRYNITKNTYITELKNLNTMGQLIAKPKEYHNFPFLNFVYEGKTAVCVNDYQINCWLYFREFNRALFRVPCYLFY